MKRLLLDATGSTNWVGGLYNRQGNLFSLTLNDWIRENVHVTVVTNPEFTGLFEDLVDNVHVKMRTISYSGERERKLKLLFEALRHRCKYVYPNIDDRACRLFGLTGIYFVPDYQYYHYPENFTKEEFDLKAAYDKKTASSKYPLVLTGHTNVVDFRNFVSKDKKNVYEIPFIACSEKDIRSLDDEYVGKVCDKYGVIPGRFIMTSNQFWAHKNHITVIKAIRILSDRNRVSVADDQNDNKLLPGDIKFLFTGQLVEYRTDDYIQRIRALFEEPEIKDRVVCTGYLERREQLALMKGAAFVIQPSLFEGWGASLDDARVLDKKVILSDIPVNHEHDSDKCVYFDPLNEYELADTITRVWHTDLPEDTERGIRLMYEEAKKYSSGFERLFKEN